MAWLIVATDESSNARCVLADVGRVVRTIVDDFLGWGHDGILKLPRWPLSVPQDCARAGPRMVPAR